MTIASSIEEEEELARQTLVVGVGNSLMGDEGIGPHAVRNLSLLPMPENVEVIDCGCDVLNVICHIDNPKKIIVIDAVRAGGEPGRIYRFHFDELEQAATSTGSAHQLQVVDALRLLRRICPCLSRCEITVIGIEPKVLELSTDLSEEVRESIADLTQSVLEEL